MRRLKVGYLDQDPSLIEDLSALENVLVPVLPDGRTAVRQRHDHAVELLDRLGLAAHYQAFPRSLSGGERQRVGLARALLSEPPLLIVDEPTASLDRAWADSVISMLVDYVAKGGALVAASHDPGVIAACSTLMRIDA